MLDLTQDIQSLTTFRIFTNSKRSFRHAATAATPCHSA